MTLCTAWGAFIIVLVAAVTVSGCVTSLPFGSVPSPKLRDLSSSYNAAFIANNWEAVTPFTQIRPNVYAGEYADARGQTRNFSVALSLSENGSFGRYFEVMKEYRDGGFI